MVLPAGCSRSVGVTAGGCWTRAEGAVVTNDWCIKRGIRLWDHPSMYVVCCPKVSIHTA